MIKILKTNFQSNNIAPKQNNDRKSCCTKLSQQPIQDEISFGNNRVELFKKAFEDIPLLDLEIIKPVTILGRFSSPPNPVEALLARTLVKGDNKGNFNGLAVLSQEGKLLGDIVKLNRPEDECFLNPGIGKYLRLHTLNTSYKDNRYKGVGTALIQAAKEESERLGFEGQLKVYAYNDINQYKGSPVPFYAKQGLVAYDAPEKSMKELVAEYSDPSKIDEGIYMFLLTPKNLESLKKQKGGSKG